MKTIEELSVFRGLEKQEQELLQHGGWMKKRKYEKNSLIFQAGEKRKEIGIVLSGKVYIEHTDFGGNRSVLSSVSEGQVFAETYVLCREPLLVDVTAADACEILFFNLDFLQETRKDAELWQSKIRDNLLLISMQKNRILSERIFCNTPKTIRGKLMLFLSAQAKKAGKNTFAIPFDRQGLADYLNVDRSALSKELGKMKQEKILEVQKNQFTLHQKI